MRGLEPLGGSDARGTCGSAAGTLLWLGLAVLAALAPAAVHGAPRASVLVVQVDGAIGPAMSRYVQQALGRAVNTHAPAVILELDTPGGLDTAMREIIKAILASPVPVVGYVAPSGARAASAGTYILYACALAAMAPATNLGAATPISLGGEEQPSAPISPAQPPAAGSRTPTATPGAAPALSTASERKSVNDAVAYIRSLAQLHGRNADWAESAVRGAASLPARDALQAHVIDLIAPDVPTLLMRLDGRQAIVAGQPAVLHTTGVGIVEIAPDWRTGLLLFLSHPTIAYGLLLAGIWGLLLEGYHPGGVLPGVAGAVALLLALYGLELLQVDFAGLALMGLGVGLIVGEFFLPTYGSLGIGGLAAFVIGSIILFSNRGAALQVALPLIIGVAIAGALVIAAIAALAARARRRPVTTGAEAMIGEPVEVISNSAGEYLVRYGGELWRARSSTSLPPGAAARIVRVSGLILWIEPLSTTATALPLPRGHT
ncbi:MAG TPA: nodulation protein NfeD [Steroidobacteraceae bacterium]|nr:nodulation protein NfeD [Steroidobacteraceae bacterium]